MVERSDRAPLLDWEEVPSAEQPGGAAPAAAHAKDRLSSPSNSRALSACPAPGFGWSSGPGGPTPSRSVSNVDGCSAPPATCSTQAGTDEGLRFDKEEHPSDSGPREVSLEDRMVKWEERDQIVSVFVVTFNTRSGNMLEWCLPKDMDLEGVEFKAIASGSHRVTTDFIYFRKGCYFGLACFANMAVESMVERGARMKSVGILSPSYTLLYRYMSFLEHQVRLQLQSPGHYSPLEAFYEDKRALLPPSGDGVVTAFPANTWGAAINHSMHPEMKITHPAGCMSQFIRFFGEQIMVLWKLALLRRRILIFSPPPVGVVCCLFIFNSFFLEQNNRIFQTLNEVAEGPDPTLTQESVRAMGLDPHGDKLFLLHLLEIYGYDNLLVSEQLCCS